MRIPIFLNVYCCTWFYDHRPITNVKVVHCHGSPGHGTNELPGFTADPGTRAARIDFAPLDNQDYSHYISDLCILRSLSSNPRQVV